MISDFSNKITNNYTENIVKRLTEHNCKINFLSSRFCSFKNILLLRRQKYKNIINKSNDIKEHLLNTKVNMLTNEKEALLNEIKIINKEFIEYKHNTE